MLQPKLNQIISQIKPQLFLSDVNWNVTIIHCSSLSFQLAAAGCKNFLSNFKMYLFTTLSTMKIMELQTNTTGKM
jgi:hypothetical protein